MYIEPIKSRFRIIGYTLIGLSFIYFSLEPVLSQFLPGLVYNNTVSNRFLPTCYSIFCLILIIGSALINLKIDSKLSLVVVASTLLLGLPYPLQNLYNLSHPYKEAIFIFYDLFATAVLFALAYSLIHERKIYKIAGLLLLVEWFFFEYWIALSGQYLFLGLSGMLTDMVVVLMVIYCILEIILEKISFKTIPRINEYT